MSKKLMEAISRIENIAHFGDFGRKYDDEEKGCSLREGENDEMEGEDPCWEGYEMVGTKMENGKEVPNCVPISEARVAESLKLELMAETNDEGMITEAEYQGREVDLDKPFRNSGGESAYSVYVKNDKDNVVRVNFGDADMENKRDDPEARKNFRSRHGCDNPGPKWKANYWSCKFWSTTPISELLGEAREILSYIDENIK